MRISIKKSAPSEAPLSKAARQVLAALDAAAVDLPEGVRISVELADDSEASAPELSASTSAVLAKSLRLMKTAEERFVLGVVLEPTKEMGEPDSQGDVYSAEAVRLAADKFMAEYQNMGRQHQTLVNDKVKILRNWIALEDMTINGQRVVAGTWLLGVRVEDDDMWAAVKSGEITGFSIGGYANKTPVA